MNYKITILQLVWKEEFLQSQWGAFRIKVDFRFWRDKRAMCWSWDKSLTTSSASSRGSRPEETFLTLWLSSRSSKSGSKDKRAFNFHFTLVFCFLLCTRGWKVENRTFWICSVLKLLVAISAYESCFLYKDSNMTKLLKNLVRTLGVSFLWKSRQRRKSCNCGKRMDPCFWNHY